MKRALLDTNIALDAIAAREPFRANAERIFLLAAEGKIEAFLAASAVTDIYYIARKHLPEDSVREALRNLFHVFNILDVRRQECESALDVPMDDYEDALLVVCARKANVNCIITRDKKLLALSSDTPAVVTPEAFLMI